MSKIESIFLSYFTFEITHSKHKEHCKKCYGLWSSLNELQVNFKADSLKCSTFVPFGHFTVLNMY